MSFQGGFRFDPRFTDSRQIGSEGQFHGTGFAAPLNE
jgi:hypothetical protein